MGSDLITPGLPVAITKIINPIVMNIEKENSTETIEVLPPVNRQNEITSLNIRILSAEFRQGMVGSIL